MRFLVLSYILFTYSFILSCNEDLGSIVVSPNRSVVELDKVGSSVHIITKEQINKSASTTTSGVLQEFGGFSVSTKGNKGSDPSYFNRGLARKYIRVLIDGIDLSDITAPGEEPTYIDNISLTNTESIEILNGSQGTLYGSNAIGGVISINSAKPVNAGLEGNTYVEAGSYGSIKTSETLKFLNDKYSFSLNLDGERSNGYSSFLNDEQPNLENDGYHLYGGSLNSSYEIRKDLRVNLNARFLNQFNEYDDEYSLPGDSVVHHRHDKQYGMLLDFLYLQKNFSHKISFQPTYTTRISTTGAAYEYDGRRKKIEYINSGKLNKKIDILSGFEYMKLQADISGVLSEKEVYSIFSEFRINPLSATFIDISARREYDSYYDTFDTGRLQVNQRAGDNIILRSSLGTGYRAPVASELFDPTYGNENLEPEKSLSYDFGIDYKIPSYNTNVYFSGFKTRIEDIITAPAPSYVSKQSIEALTSKGFETSIDTKVSKKNILKISHTRTIAKQDDGDISVLVPKDKIITSFDSQLSNSINLNTYYVFQNKVKDKKYLDLPCYKSLNFNLNYNLQNSIMFFLKVENVLDRENVINRVGQSSNNLGFKSPDRSFYFGVNLKN